MVQTVEPEEEKILESIIVAAWKDPGKQVENRKSIVSGASYAKCARKRAIIVDLSSISLVLILYLLLPNASIMSTYSNILNYKPGENIQDITEMDINIANDRSLFGLVSALPAPKPATPAAKTSGSSSHRLPPIHGSIFGKRSLADNGIPSLNDNLDDRDLAAFLDALDEQQDRDKKIIKRSNHRFTWK